MADLYTVVEFKLLQENGSLAPSNYLIDLRAFHETVSHPSQHVCGVVTAVVHGFCEETGGYYTAAEGEVEVKPGVQHVDVILSRIESPYFGPPSNNIRAPVYEDAPGFLMEEDPEADH